MNYSINQIIARLNEQRKTVQLRHKTYNSEIYHSVQLADPKRKHSTLDPPTMSMHLLELDVIKHNEQPQTKRIANKKLIIQQRKYQILNRRQEQQPYLPQIDFSLLKNDPLPITYNKTEKMVKLKKRASVMLDY